MSSVALFQTPDDGDIKYDARGTIATDSGLVTAAYLSLFGGNESGYDWWGDLLDSDPARKYPAETQRLLTSIPLTSYNLRRVEDAARRDLAWFIDSRAASVVDVAASVPRRDTLQLDIKIGAYGEETQFTFVENWRATA